MEDKRALQIIWISTCYQFEIREINKNRGLVTGVEHSKELFTGIKRNFFYIVTTAGVEHSKSLFTDLKKNEKCATS